MKHLTLFFAFGALLFLSCQTVSARGVKIPFGDREVLNKVADLPDTEEYKTDNGNYIDLGTIHQEFNIAYLLPLYIEKEPRLVGYCEKEDTYYELTEEQREELINRLLERGKVSGRSDDNLETIKSRLDVYHKQTAPLADYYIGEGKHVAIKGMGTIEEIFGRIKDAVNNL